MIAIEVILLIWLRFSGEALGGEKAQHPIRLPPDNAAGALKRLLDVCQ